MSNDEYHARPEFSSSQLKDMLRSGAHFYSKNIIKEVERETKKHLDFGTLAHTLFLEPEQFHNEFAVIPADAPKPPTDVMRNAKNPSEDSMKRVQWWDKFAAEHGTKITITEDLLEGAQRIANNLCSLSSYKDMQNNYGMAEASIFFTDPTYGLKLRVRPDYHIAPCSAFPNGLILDLKTTTDARAHGFAKKCGDFCYDLSAAMYREGFQEYYSTAEKPDFIFLVAESALPFNVKQYKASDLFLSVGETRYNKSKARLAESLLIDEWDGYPTEMEEIFLPSYMTKQALENDFN
nr:PD-(D/E)XK nuclease-like domain-containing protein [Acinetobacter lwoffii]